MSRMVLKSIKILPFTQDYGQQWRRVFCYGLNSYLYGKNIDDCIDEALRCSECVPTNKCIVFNSSHLEGSTFINDDLFSNTLLFADNEKEVKREKFYSKTFGDCEIEHRKNEKGVYKIVVCKKGEKKRSFDSRDLSLNPDASIFKMLGAIALTLFGIILAAYSTVFFVTLAANVICIVAIISFFVISFRVIKHWWLRKR